MTSHVNRPHPGWVWQAAAMADQDQGYRAAAPVDRPLLIGTTGCVVRLNEETGEEVWRVEVGNLGLGDVSMVLHGAWVYAAAHEAVARIRLADGHIVWRTISKKQDGVTSMALQLETNEPRLIVAGHGRCFAYAPDDGRLLWSNELKGLGYGAVALRYEGAVIAQQVSYLAGKHTATMEERQYG